MATCLVTGGSGFLGRNLVRLLTADEVVVAGRRPSENWRGRFVAVDLEDAKATEETIEETRPAVVYHLAGRTPPAEPAAFYRGNTLATVHLLDALRRLGRPVRVVIAGSAAELGPVEAEDLPVAEDYPPRPADGYGLSKWLASTAGLAARPPLEVVVGRIFNPIGPGMPASQALGRMAATLARPGPDPVVLRVGDLETRRDLIDVRDAATALVALAQRGTAGRVYHVGTGTSRRIGEGLDVLVRLSGRDARIETDATVVARPGPRDSRADIRRIVAETGWRPEVRWEQSLADLWDAACAGRGCH